MTKKPNLTLWDHIPFPKSTPSPDLKFELRKLQIENENLRDKIESVIDQGKEKDSEIFALTCQLSEIKNLFSNQGSDHPLYATVLKKNSPSPKLTSLGKIKLAPQTYPSLPSTVPIPPLTSVPSSVPSSVSASPSASIPPASIRDCASVPLSSVPTSVLPSASVPVSQSSMPRSSLSENVSCHTRKWTLKSANAQRYSPSIVHSPASIPHPASVTPLMDLPPPQTAPPTQGSAPTGGFPPTPVPPPIRLPTSTQLLPPTQVFKLTQLPPPTRVPPPTRHLPPTQLPPPTRLPPPTQKPSRNPRPSGGSQPSRGSQTSRSFHHLPHSQPSKGYLPSQGTPLSGGTPFSQGTPLSQGSPSFRGSPPSRVSPPSRGFLPSQGPKPPSFKPSNGPQPNQGTPLHPASVPSRGIPIPKSLHTIQVSQPSQGSPLLQGYMPKKAMPPKKKFQQTQIFQPSAQPPPNKIRIYHDSNLKWSSPREIKKVIKNLNLGDADSYDIDLCFTPKLEDLLEAVQNDDNRRTKVIIATMTNNVKAHQPISKCQSLLQRAVNILKTQILGKNVIFLESPPSLNFDIFHYNKMAFQLCKKSGVVFSLNLLVRHHIKSDGLHIKAQCKHVMLESVAAAITGKEPYAMLGLIPSIRRPFF